MLCHKAPRMTPAVVFVFYVTFTATQVVLGRLAARGVDKVAVQRWQGSVL